MNETPFSTVATWDGGWDETGLREWAAHLRQRLGPRPVTLGLLFTTPEFVPHARELLELVRVHAQVPALAGCSTHALVAGGRELEGSGGLVLGLYSLPGASVQTIAVPASAADAGASVRAQGIEPAGVTGWLAFLEPFHLDAEAWIESWQAAFPGAPIFGGLASGQAGKSRAQVYRDGEVIDEGGVIVAVRGLRMLGMVAQGCTPIGETWTITRVEGNFVHRIGNRPAVAVLEETFAELSDEVKQRSRGNFFAGLVMDEYRDDYNRGDFLIRSLLGADPNSGAIAVGALPRTGQTLQFQLRDAAAADKDIRAMLGRLRDAIGHARIYGGCLCVCSGRGRGLFGEEDHDAGLVRQIIGTPAIAGFFCNGEFGPVGSKSFVHSYTASLALFVGPPRKAEDEL